MRWGGRTDRRGWTASSPRRRWLRILPPPPPNGKPIPPPNMPPNRCSNKSPGNRHNRHTTHATANNLSNIYKKTPEKKLLLWWNNSVFWNKINWLHLKTCYRMRKSVITSPGPHAVFNSLNAMSVVNLLLLGIRQHLVREADLLELKANWKLNLIPADDP